MKKKLLSFLLAIQMVVMLAVQADPMAAAAEGNPSAALSASQVAVFNIAGADGFVKVTGLTGGDKVSVYHDEAGGSSIGSGDADTNGVATVNVGASALAPEGGSVYATVTQNGKAESARTKIDYQQQILPWQVYSHTGNWGENIQWSTMSTRKMFSSSDGTAAHPAYSGGTLYPAYPVLTGSNNTDDDLSHNVFLNKHIVIKGTGSRVSFYGYGYPGYNDFVFLPIAGTDEKDVSFNFDLSTVSFHTLYGAGFLFNVVDNGNGTINGYALLFHSVASDNPNVDDPTQRTMELYRLINVDKNILNNSAENIEFQQTNGISMVDSIGVFDGANTNFPAGGSFLNDSMHYMKLQIKQAGVNTEAIVQNSSTGQDGTYTTVMDNKTLDPAGASGVGLIASYIHHNCSILSYLTFNDVSIKTMKNSVPTEEGWPIVDLSASSGTAIGQAALTFTSPADAASVILQQSTDGTNWSTAVTSSPIEPSSSSAVVTGLTNGTEYSYRLLVDGGSYAGISNTATVTPSGTQNPVTVTFDSGSANTQATPTSEVVNQVTKNLGTLPTPPSKAGYAFKGWSTSNAAGATPDFDASTTVTASRTVYAVWEAYTATATPMYLPYGTVIPANGTAGGTATSELSSGSCTLTATPADGYNFIGWYTDASCTSLASTSWTYTTTLSGNTTLYALFKQTPALTITQQPVGGSYLTGDTITPLTFTATGREGGLVAYQWYLNDQMMPNAISSTLAISSLPQGQFNFYCVATEEAPGWDTISVHSTTAVVYVNDPVTLSAPPSSVTYGDQPFTLTAGGGSGSGDYVWSITGGALLTAGGTNNDTATVTVTSAGSFSVSVHRQGDESSSATTGNVTVGRKSVTITAASSDKPYDGTKTASISGTPSLSDTLSGDDVHIVNGTASFDSADAGDNKAVTFSGFSIAGNDVGNYVLSAQPHSVNADIKPAAITVTPDGSQSKYLGMPDPSLTFTSTGAVSGETPAFSGALARAQGEQAGNYAISTGDLALVNSGSFKAGNYTLKLNTTETDFRIAPLTGTPEAVSDTPNGAHDWFVGGAPISLKAPSGYLISADGSVWSDQIPISSTDGTGKTADYYLRRVSDHATTGLMTSPVYKVDSVSPTGTISVGQNIWHSFLNTITLGCFFKDTQSVSISAADDGSGIADVQYLLSSDPIPAADIAGATGWTDGTSFPIMPDCRKIVYARITDNAGNVAYISSDGLVLDATAPTIAASVSGSFADGYKTVSATCADEGSGVASAMWLPGSYTAGTFDTGAANNLTGTFQATQAGDYTVYAVDKSGNATARVVTVPKDAQTAFSITDPGSKIIGNPSFTLSTAGGNGSGDVTFSVPENNGVVTLSGNTVTIVGVGTVTVTATKAADRQYDAATATYTLRVNPITYSVTANAYYKNNGDTAYRMGSVGGTASAAQSSVVAGNTASLTAAPTQGYVFDGWFTSPQGGTPVATTTAFSPKIGADSVYYALFSETGYTVSGTAIDDQPAPQPVAGATVVTALAGVTTAGPVTTDASGNFTLPGVSAGIYDLVIKFTDTNNHLITVTRIITVTGNTAIGKITIPTGQKNTVFDPTSGPTVNAIANLDDVYDNVNGNTLATHGVTQSDLQTVINGGSVTVKVVTSSVDNASEQNQAAAVSGAAQSDSRIIAMQLDISAFKQVTPLNMGTTTTTLTQLNNLITIYIPLPADMQGKTGYVVYRYHGSAVDKITETPNAAGEYFTISGDTLILTVQKFCVYALAYADTTRQIPNPPTGGSAGKIPLALAIFSGVGLPFVLRSKAGKSYRSKKGASGRV